MIANKCAVNAMVVAFIRFICCVVFTTYIQNIHVYVDDNAKK